MLDFVEQELFKDGAVHCPKCGSTILQWLKTTVDQESGIKVEEYLCQSCKQNFSMPD